MFDSCSFLLGMYRSPMGDSSKLSLNAAMPNVDLRGFSLLPDQANRLLGSGLKYKCAGTGFQLLSDSVSSEPQAKYDSCS